MKLTIKTLVKLTFQVQIEPDKTVKELKETIEKEQGKDYPSGAQKLIYNGKILADENKLSEYEFDEKKFVVLMITRAPPPPKPANTEPASKQKSDDKPKPTASTRQAQASTTSATATTPSSTATTTTVSSTPASARPAPITTTNTASRQQQQQQLLASRNLSDIAGLSSMSEPQLASRLAAMMSQPHFRQMQDLIQQSPHLLSSTIESLAASDPDMYNFISENPDVFVSALNHPPLAGSRPSGQRQPSSRAEARGVPQQGGGPPPVADQMLTNVSEHDKEAIERLKELGFSEYLAVQAYMACDKDEQLAANLLFQMEQ